MMRYCRSRIGLSDCKSGMLGGLWKSTNSLVVETHGFRSEEIVYLAAVGQAAWGQFLHRVDFPSDGIASVLDLFDDDLDTKFRCKRIPFKFLDGKKEGTVFETKIRKC
jgi:hypothetical protein